MQNSSIASALAALTEEACVEIADTPQLLQQAYRLRYEVYCVERSFLTGQDGIERDDYDDFSRHAVVRWRDSDVVIGTVRLVLPKLPAGGDDYPVQHVCDPGLLRDLPLETTGEVSRFALAKMLRKQAAPVSAASCSLLRLALIQGAVRLSAEAGHTHWLAVMEPTLLRLLAATGVHFKPLGPPVEYHGLRQPAIAELVPTLARLHEEQPLVWDFITRRGTWYPESRTRGHRRSIRASDPQFVAA